jgi:hypothetical protein
MPELRATISFELDGIPLPDMPIVRRYIVSEASTGMTIIATPDSNTSSFHAIQAAIMPILGTICVTNDQACNLEINQNTPLPMNAGGFVLIMGANLAQGTPNTNVEYNNPSSTVNVTLGIPVLGGT